MEEVKNVRVEDGARKLEQVHEFDDFVAPSFSFSCFFEPGNSSGSSSLELSDSFEEVTSSASSSSSSSADPFSDMSSLLQQLPIKRGLSKYYQGKAQSFASLAKVKSLEDLAKPENPYKKKLKSCKSIGEEIAIKRSSCSSLSAKKGTDNNFMGNKPSIPPHKSPSSNTIPNNNQALLLV